MLYARIFVGILDSSIAEDWKVRHVFEDILKLVDSNGVIDMTLTAFSRRTNTPLDAGDEPDYQVTRVRIIHLP